MVIILRKISPKEQSKLDLIKKVFKIGTDAGALRKLLDEGEIKIGEK